MSTAKRSAEHMLLTKEQEARLKESLQESLASANPNPDRIGCPSPRILRDVAFHKKLGNPKLFEEVTLHLAQCSACVRDAIEYGEEYKDYRQQGRRRHKNAALLAAAAGVILSVAVWTIWQFQTKPPRIDQARDVGTPPAGGSPANRDEGREKKQPQVTEYQRASLELPSRWRNDPRAEQPTLALSRGKLLVTVRLPVGSPDGKYEFRILDQSKKVLAALQGTARTENGVTALTIPIDSSNWPAGNYTLNVSEPELDVWVEYGLEIKKDQRRSQLP